jgi:AcrR family transcriptional regulator
MDQILDAAAAIAEESDDEVISMNAIARAAGISPGSLYQFFSDRGELHLALVARYAQCLEAALPKRWERDELLAVDLRELIATIVDPILAVDEANPGLRKVTVRTGSIGSSVGRNPAHQAIISRIVGMLEVRAVPMPPEAAHRVAEMCVHIVRAVLAIIDTEPKARRRDLADELKLVLFRYLEPIDSRR